MIQPAMPPGENMTTRMNRSPKYSIHAPVTSESVICSQCDDDGADDRPEEIAAPPA
jgi:hypothetical protein